MDFTCRTSRCLQTHVCCLLMVRNKRLPKHLTEYYSDNSYTPIFAVTLQELAPDSCYLHPFKPVRTGLVTGEKSKRTLAKQSALLQENINNIHEIWCTSTKSEMKKYSRQTNCNKPSSDITEDDWSDSLHTGQIQPLHPEQLNQPCLCISPHYCAKNAEARDVEQPSSANKGP